MTNLLISKSLINDVLIPQELIEMVIDIFDQRTSDIIESGDDPNISPVEFSAKLSIYNGYCGYLLFFIDCSHADCWDPFLAERIDKCIETGMGIVTQLKLRLRSGIGSLLTGYSGISYCCLRYWQKNRNDQYLNHALSIISESASDQTVCASEHMVGLSGLLSLVCYCYKETEIDCLTEIAESIADRIVNAKIPYSNGYVWDFSRNHIRPLCGYAHGVSGIAHALSMASNVCHRDDYKEVADTAIAYEDSQFSLEKKNWPNWLFVFENYKEVMERISAYLNREYHVVERPSYMYAWCHGGVGIVQQRSEMYKVWPGTAWKENYSIAIDAIISYVKDQSWDINNSGICHGLGGIIDMLVSLNHNSLYSIDQETSSYLTNQVQRIISDIDRPSLESGLFNGTVGLLWAILRATNPNNIHSILVL